MTSIYERVLGADFERLHPMVFPLCLRMLHNLQEAEETTQEVFARFFGAGEGVAGGEGDLRLRKERWF